MQEYVEEKSVAIVIKAAKITEQLLARAMQDFLKKLKEPAAPKQGKGIIKIA